MRNMLILLDQRGNNETIGKPENIYLTNKLQSALEEQACPILINASLWSAFLEKRKSIEQVSLFPNTPEQKVVTLHKNINDKLNYWYKHCNNNGLDPLHARQCMINKVNEEFYSQEAVLKAQEKKEGPISQDINLSFISYLTKFNKADWQAYTNNNSFYLLIPKKYVQALENNRQDYPNSETLSSREIILGLKVDHLTEILNYDDPAQCYFHAELYKDSLPKYLNNFFVTKKDFNNNKMPYSWNIILSGHGGSSYKEITEETIKVETHPIIADLTPESFGELLQFMDHDITTNCFHFATCYGAGNRLKMLFNDNGNKVYNYPIITDCLSDGYSICLWKKINFPSLQFQQLHSCDVAHEDTSGWHLAIDHQYRWKKFFKSLSQNSFIKSNLEWLAPTLAYITQNMITTTSLVRLPESSDFITVLPDFCMKINDQFLKEYTKEIILDKNITTVLLESALIENVILTENKIQAPRIISLLPGDSIHFIKHLALKSNHNLLSSFWPIEGDRFNRQFLIEKLVFPSNDFPLLKQIGLNEEKICLKNIYIHAQKGSLLRIFFQTESNKAFMITGNKLDLYSNEVSLKGILELSPEIEQIHLKRYTQLKQELILKK